MASKKKVKITNKEKRYVALNTYDEAYVVGTLEEVKAVMCEWFNENENLEEGEVELYELGERKAFEVTRDANVWLR